MGSLNANELRAYWCNYCHRHFFIPGNAPKSMPGMDTDDPVLSCPWCDDNCWPTKEEAQ